MCGARAMHFAVDCRPLQGLYIGAGSRRRVAVATITATRTASMHAADESDPRTTAGPATSTKSAAAALPPAKTRSTWD